MTPDKAKQIRAAMRKALAGVAMKMANVLEKDDERYPEDHRVTRRTQRAELVREWNAIESRYHAELQQWAQEARQESERLRASDPIGTPEAESRRVSENMEIGNIAAPYIGQPVTMVRNRLLPEARRLLALDLPDKARIYLEAARRAGVEDSVLSEALEDAYDRTIPHRRQARAILTVVQDQQDLLDNDRFSARLVHNVGDQVRASTAAKLIAARRGQPTPAGLLDGRHGEAQLHAAARESGTAE